MKREKGHSIFQEYRKDPKEASRGGYHHQESRRVKENTRKKS